MKSESQYNQHSNTCSSSCCNLRGYPPAKWYKLNCSISADVLSRRTDLYVQAETLGKAVKFMEEMGAQVFRAEETKDLTP